MTAAAAAETAVTAALQRSRIDAAAAGAQRSAVDAQITVAAGQVTAGPWRDLVQVDLTGWRRYRRPADGLAGIQALMDGALTAVQGTRLDADAHWIGWGADELAWSDVDQTESDGIRWATADLTVRIAVDRQPAPARGIGPAEAAVRAVLADAGVDTADSSDRPPMAVTRWGGTADDDPARHIVQVWAAVDPVAGDLEAWAATVWQALDASPDVSWLGAVDVDLAGAPPDSDGVYHVAAMTATVLI